MDEIKVPDDISEVFDSNVSVFEFNADEAHRYGSHLFVLLRIAEDFVNVMRNHVAHVNPDQEGSIVRMLVTSDEYEVAIQAVNTDPAQVWSISMCRNCSAFDKED